MSVSIACMSEVNMYVGFILKNDDTAADHNRGLMASILHFAPLLLIHPVLSLQSIPF